MINMEAVLEDPVQTQAETEAVRDLGGKYLTFMLNDEEYGLEILKVREIIGLMDITKVPQTPDFVEGVINLRGKVIPVIDLRSKFGLPRAEYNEETCTIVVDVGMMMGIIVDTVREVHDIPAEDIEPPPRLGGAVDTTFILGMGKVKDDVKILLDIDKVLTSEELVTLQSMGQS
jgi:purine-binding chemotaxis protein CheW